MRPEVILLFAIISGVTIIIWSLVLRYKRQELLHQERMIALEKGAPVPVLPVALEIPSAGGAPRIYLLRGMIWLFTGIGLTIFLYNIAFATRVAPGPRSLEERLLRVQNLRNQGVPEDQLKELFEESKHEVRPSQKIPETIGTLGLVPIGVGLAYLLFYAIEGRRMKGSAASEGTRNSADSSMKNRDGT